MPRPVVHLLCGLNGAGKTTLARRLADEGSLHLSLDGYMIENHPGLRYDDPDYGPRAHEAIEVLWSAAADAVRDGRSVVLDWNQWSRAKRADASSRARRLGADPILHWVDVSVDLAVQRARDRRDPASHLLDEDHVRQMPAIFETPAPDEGIPIVRHTIAEGQG